MFFQRCHMFDQVVDMSVQHYAVAFTDQAAGMVLCTPQQLNHTSHIFVNAPQIYQLNFAENLMHDFDNIQNVLANTL